MRKVRERFVSVKYHKPKWSDFNGLTFYDHEQRLQIWFCAPLVVTFSLRSNSINTAKVQQSHFRVAFGDARFKSRPAHQLSSQMLHAFTQALKANTGIVPWLGHSCFLPNHLKFIIHLSFYHSALFFLIGIVEGGVQLGPFGTAATNKPTVPADGEIGGMMIGRGNWSTRERTCPSAALSTTNPTCSAQTRTQAAAVGSQQLTAWATFSPILSNLPTV
jgi:hypothetical protein